VRRTILIAAALLLCSSATAQAHMLRHPRRMTAGQQLRYAERTIAHARTEIRWARSELHRVRAARGKTTDSTDPRRASAWRDHVIRARVILQGHAWLLTYGRQQLAAANARLLPAHYAGWRCITNGAYPGAPHEGNGYNGPYSGPLGMTTPWMGFRPPGPDWVHSPVVAVYRIAETVMARSGFSYGSMRGQWPLTFPPCAGYFR
jgi:hypothetical protein